MQCTLPIQFLGLFPFNSGPVLEDSAVQAQARKKKKRAESYHSVASVTKISSNLGEMAELKIVLLNCVNYFVYSTGPCQDTI